MTGFIQILKNNISAYINSNIYIQKTISDTAPVLKPIHKKSNLLNQNPNNCQISVLHMCKLSNSKAWLANPGVLNKENIKATLKEYEEYYDKKIFEKKKSCKTCKIPK